MDITERFLNYTTFDTQSQEDSDQVPSTEKQLVFANYLKKELENEGLSDVEMDDKGYIYATLKANVKGHIPTIGFISHYDTSPDCSGADIKARIVNNYDGSDILLSEGIVSSPKKFPELLKHVGEDLIVTDGHTLLGADDKAGIAEIIQAMCWLRDHPEVKHGKIRIAFNPDEEIGMGAHHFDVGKFGCDWAYTMDGGDVGELEFENFNAASAKITIKGISVHPGYAKGKMINAMKVIMEANAMLPDQEVPERTQDREGFYHLTGARGSVSEASADYILRDHDAAKIAERKQKMQEIARALNEKYGDGTVACVIKDQYRNMAEVMADYPEVIDAARKAIQASGLTPSSRPVRGGTDGAQLSFRGLPCPNLGTGGYAYHGFYEYAVAEEMDTCVEILLQLVREYAGA